jgi:hypothetical protein
VTFSDHSAPNALKRSTAEHEFPAHQKSLKRHMTRIAAISKVPLQKDSQCIIDASKIGCVKNVKNVILYLTLQLKFVVYLNGKFTD